MSVYARRIGLVAILLALAVSLGGAAFGQADPSNLPIIGTWRVNLDKSSPGIRKVRTAAWTCIYAAENGGIRHTVYDVYPPKYSGLPTTGVAPHDHTYWFKLDGTQAYKDPEGPNGEEQTVAMWLVDNNTIFRQRQTKGEDDERVLYVVSPDGDTLTWFVWSANKPDPKGQTNKIVWDRVKSEGAQNEGFDPHNLNGSWIGTRVFFGDDNRVPEPPLTPWGKEHLLTKTISHNALGTGAPQANTGPDAKKTDYNGVPANVTIGGYPGERCEPIGAPAQFNYTGAYPFQFIMLPDRMYQMFENHREWRVIWLNRDHPKSVFPSYMGDSIAKWDGDTLVVDTIGYNGKDWISENLGEYVSDSFHLVERYHLTDATHMDLDMVYYDPKAWGDKPWPGWKKQFKLDSKGDSMEEQMCDPSHWNDYDGKVSNPVK